jgi:MinD-like ATPase involved in chromosome partitioning or flagellar assembly
LPHLVVNRTRSRDEAMRTAAKLNAVTKKFLEVESELPGWICLDPQIETSIRNQRPLTLYGQCQGLEDRRSICAAALAALPPMKRRQEPRKEAVRNVRLRPTVPQA